MQRRSWHVPVALAVLFGLSLLFLRGAVAGLGWTLAALLLNIVLAVATALASRGDPRRAGRPSQVLVLGLALAVLNLGLCLALDQLGVAVGITVLGAMPLFATLTGQVWGLERITGVAALGLVIGFVGLFLVVAFPPAGDTWSFIAGILAGLTAALAAAFASRYSALRLGGRPRAWSAAAIVAAVACLPLALLVRPSAPVSVTGFLVIGLLGLVGLTVAPAFARRRTDAAPSLMGVVKLGGLVVAVIAAVLLTGDRLSAAEVVGLVLVLAGTALVLGLVPGRFLVGARR